MTRPYEGKAAYLTWSQTRRVAAVLLKARLSAGREQQEVARAAGMSPGKLSHGERALTRMRPGDALALAAVLGVDAAELGLGGAQ